MTDTTLFNTQRRFTLPKGAHKLFYYGLSSCNMGLTNPEYKGTQQDLTDEKERLQGYVGFKGDQGKSVARIKINFLQKKLTNVCSLLSRF